VGAVAVGEWVCLSGAEVATVEATRRCPETLAGCPFCRSQSRVPLSCRQARRRSSQRARHAFGPPACEHPRR
jgi:hypothetical protein